jgi:KDO2-lipid IV(A) lauroyltransferase
MAKNKPIPHMANPKCWPAWMAVAVGWLVVRLPFTWLIATGRGFGWLAYRLGGSRRHFAEVNLKLCFPRMSASERQLLVRSTFRHMGVGIMETALTWLNPAKKVSQRFTIEGLEHYQKAMKQGKGVLVLGGHFACLDMASSTLQENVDLVLMYRKNKNPVWEWLQVRGRHHYFDGVLERSETRKVFKALKAGRAIWYAADQDYGPKHSVFAPFFGVSTATITATARFANLNNSPTLLMSQFRNLEDNSYTLRFSPILEDFPTGDDVADATISNAVLEKEIRKHPDQYLWLHRRFKTRPRGEASFY